MNIVNSLTTYDLERLLAIEQIKHYVCIKVAAAGIGDKTEYRRAIDHIDRLTTEYGIEARRQAESEYHV